MDILKKELLAYCEKFIQQKMEALQTAMLSLKIDLENESKSSAGDKFETGREMINIEWNKLSNQLQQYQQMQLVLQRVQTQIPNGIAKLGSVVFTANANYFISIPAGEISTVSSKFYAVGIKAPVATALLGKTIGDSFFLNGRQVQISDII